MSEIAVRHTREENYAHTNDWKKPYDGNIFDMFKDGSFELIDLSNPFGRGNPLWPSKRRLPYRQSTAYADALQTASDFQLIPYAQLYTCRFTGSCYSGEPIYT